MTDLIPHIHFDSHDYQPDAAFEVWRQTLSSTYDVQQLDNTPFEAMVDGWAIDDLFVTENVIPGVRFVRDAAKIRSHGGDKIIFMHLVEGDAVCTFDGPDVMVAGGATMVFDTARPFTGTSAKSRSITVSVPRARLVTAMRDAHDLHGTIIEGQLGRLLGDHLASIAALASQTPQADAAIFARTTVHLLAACVTPRAGGKSDTPLLAFAIRHDITRYIDKNLHRSDLDPARICADLDLSRAAAYRAFRGTEGIASHIRTRRLQAARVMLENPEERRSVADVASAVGFADPALFSRVYRRVFGRSPRESRSANLSPIEVSGQQEDLRQWFRDLDTHFAQHRR